jgi:hypothetical protein
LLTSIKRVSQKTINGLIGSSFISPAREQNQLLSVSMSMEEPENFVDHVHLIDCQSRQVGRANVVREWIAALEAQGKRVVVIGMDSPRLPLLGAAMAPIGDPEMDRVDAFRIQLDLAAGYFNGIKIEEPTLLGRPSAGKTMLSSIDRMLPPEESRDAMFDRFMTSMMTPSREWLDPIPEPIVKKEKNKLGFLDGLGYKKRKDGR